MDINNQHTVYKIWNNQTQTGFWGVPKYGYNNGYRAELDTDMATKFGGQGKNYMSLETVQQDYLKLYQWFTTREKSESSERQTLMDDFTKIYEIRQFTMVPEEFENHQLISDSLKEVFYRKSFIIEVQKLAGLSPSELMHIETGWNRYRKTHPFILIFKYRKEPKLTSLKIRNVKNAYNVYFFKNEEDMNLVRLTSEPESIKIQTRYPEQI